ncbi:MAG: NAD(P)-binding domain-containing protein [Frankiaceae bacterium]
MQFTDTIVLGAGHAGLAVSRLLTDRGRDHVMLDRGRIAERWLSQRWDSLRLLTPNWMTRLPGWSYRGDDPDGFMRAADLAAYLDTYALSFGAPVYPGVEFESVRAAGGEYPVGTSSGTWSARNVVIATGYCDLPSEPAVLHSLAPGIRRVSAAGYRNPDELSAGGVLVVGASASGAQISDELARAGRDVVLAVGAHTRIPRRYRGRDIMFWLDAMGLLDRSAEQVADLEQARREPSLQLVGRPDGRDLDLATLQSAGVRLAGRLMGADAHTVRFATDLRGTVAGADERLRRLLARIDRYAEQSGLAGTPPPAEPVPPVRIVGYLTDLNLRAAGITTVVSATGFRREYPWLQVPVLDPAGEIRQHRGVTPAAGLYVVGLRFQTRRNSTFIDGARHDARLVVDHLSTRRAPATAPTLRRAG